MPNEDTLPVVAEQEGTPQSEGYSADELRAMMRDEIGVQLGPFAQAVTDRLAPVEQITAAVKDLMGRSAKTEALLDRLFKGTMTEADYTAVTEKLEQDALREKVRQRDEADRKAAEKAAQAVPPTAGDGGLEADWQETFGPRAMAYARKQGVDYSQVYPQFPKQIGRLRSGRPDWNAHMDKIEDVIDRQADADRKAAQAKVKAPTTQPSGAREPADLSKGGLSLFQKHFEERSRAG